MLNPLLLGQGQSKPRAARSAITPRGFDEAIMRRSSSEATPSPVGEVAQLDQELYRLARGAGRLRPRIGQALHCLGDGIHELGFSTLGAYALERCNRGGRRAAESRTLARRLHSLPHLSTALEAGSEAVQISGSPKDEAPNE